MDPYKRREVNDRMVEPLIHTPLADVLRRMSSKQDTICAMFETQWYRCLEAFGQKLGRKYCDLERRDLNECLTNYKQKKRAEWIQTQYDKHWDENKHGKRPEGPKVGEAYPDYFSNNPSSIIQ